jgi:threonine dehydrogenase-like Zn-dependent dehydrogenase
LLGQRVAALSFKAYAQYDVADVAHLVQIPVALDGKPVPGEALGCAMNIFARSDIRAGHTVAIVGIGFLGALLTQLATNAGAQVIAISRRSCALSLARTCGAKETILMEDHHAIIGRVKELTQGRFCPRVIEATGEQWPLDLASELSAEGGRLMIAGYHQNGPRQVNMQLWNWRGLDVINAHERDLAVATQGIERALDEVVRGRIDPTPLYSHTFSLHDLGSAFQTLRSRPQGFLKALVTMEGAA